jgi:phosphatidylinositol-3,4,5-trisphosphate 3-phosphatase and dual-specificity protein phosphatase PTEN
MKTLLREMVSGSKNRYKDDYFNLDLTYITPRIIAMSLPADGIISSAYRNELSEVAQFLHEHHGSNYLVVNLSMKKYSYEKLKGEVNI